MEKRDEPVRGKKRWDHNLRDWVVDLPVDLTEPEQPAEVERSKAREAARKAENKTPRDGVQTYGHSHYESQWTPIKPWDGVDRFRWPNTFLKLVQLYYDGAWHQHGKYIPDEFMKKRLAGDYSDKPNKYGYYTTPHVYSGKSWQEREHERKATNAYWEERAKQIAEEHKTKEGVVITTIHEGWEGHYD